MTGSGRSPGYSPKYLPTAFPARPGNPTHADVFVITRDPKTLPFDRRSVLPAVFPEPTPASVFSSSEIEILSLPGLLRKMKESKAAGGPERVSCAPPLHLPKGLKSCGWRGWGQERQESVESERLRTLISPYARAQGLTTALGAPASPDFIRKRLVRGRSLSCVGAETTWHLSESALMDHSAQPPSGGPVVLRNTVATLDRWIFKCKTIKIELNEK